MSNISITSEVSNVNIEINWNNKIKKSNDKEI